jgi:hypothetical protein
MTTLPTFRGYTVDERLQEFRKVEQTPDGPSITFHPFDSPAGAVMLRAYLTRNRRRGA